MASTAITAILEIFTAILEIFTIRLSRSTRVTADAAKGALIATARPKIIVRKVEAVFLFPLVAQSLCDSES